MTREVPPAGKKAIVAGGQRFPKPPPRGFEFVKAFPFLDKVCPPFLARKTPPHGATFPRAAVPIVQRAMAKIGGERA
eukprot:7824259-Lingulodinium_polyedra.AAC.1